MEVCPTMYSELKLRLMLDTLRQSPEPKELVDRARRALTQALHRVVREKQRRKNDSEEEKRGRGSGSGQSRGRIEDGAEKENQNVIVDGSEVAEVDRDDFQAGVRARQAWVEARIARDRLERQARRSVPASGSS
jgi:hypothetical protein